MVLLFRIILSI